MNFLQPFVVLVALLSVAFAQETYDANPNYNFEYAVADPVTGDQKSQSETRNGDTVTGYYQLLEPDGTYRTVNYVADPIGGFRASVSKSGAPVAKAAPVIKPIVSVVPKIAAPAPVVIAPKPVVPAAVPVSQYVTSASASYPYYSAYPGYSAYPYSSYPYYNYNGYYPYYSGYYPYNYYKK